MDAARGPESFDPAKKGFRWDWWLLLERTGKEIGDLTRSKIRAGQACLKELKGTPVLVLDPGAGK